MPPRRPIRVLANSTEIIQVLSERGPLTPAEIAETIGVPRPTAYRLVSSLNSVGLTRTGDDSRVSLNLRWLHLADAALEAMSEWSESRRILDALAEATGQTAFLTVPRDSEAVCIDWAPGRGIAFLILKPGRVLPYYAGAAGRTMLAFSDSPDDYLAGAPFPPLTNRTLTTADELRADIEATRAAGYAFSDEDATTGMGALGMPVVSSAGRLRGCVSIGGLAGDMHEHRDEFLVALRQAAEALG